MMTGTSQYAIKTGNQRLGRMTTGVHEAAGLHWRLADLDLNS
jgi:hypothetical protein